MDFKGMKVIGRSKWGAKCGRGGATSYTPNTTIFIHHSAGQGLNIDSYAEQVNAMRAIEHYHCRVNGWDGIGYNFVVFQPFKRRLWHRARVFEGRGLGHIPAAQAGHNAGNIAVCVVGNFQHEPVRDGTVNKLVSLVRRLPGRKLRGHRNVSGTDCPGDNLYSKLRSIRERAGKV